MERAIALKKLGKLLGKKLGYRIDAKASSQEERIAAKAELPTAIENLNKLKELRDERHKAVLSADAEYQTLHAAHRAASDRTEQLSSIIRHRKITVGTSEGMFFLIKAEGDSWEEVIDILTAEKQPVS